MTINPLESKFLTAVKNLDWNDVNEAEKLTRQLSDRLTGNSSQLNLAMEYVQESTDLFSKSESDGFFDRVVLYDDPKSGLSIRLHSIVPDCIEQPHNHRATFAAFQLKGGYRHTSFNLPTKLIDIAESHEHKLKIPDEFTDQLEPVSVRWESAGDSYLLHHTAVHDTSSDGDQLSLVIRGPAEKDRLLFIHSDEQYAEWMYGGAFEPELILAGKKMDSESFESVWAKLNSV